MSNSSDIVDLASEIADIARSTTDPETGSRLMRLVRQLLTEAGLDIQPDRDGANAEQRGDSRLSAAVAD
jgi:hypothetical protein